MLTFYGATLSPFVKKVCLVAHEKGMDYTLQPGGMGRGDAVFEAASPFRKMPAMADGDFLLSDSSAIIHYLEAKQPDPSLIPTDPRARGRTIWWDEFADTILMAAGGAMFFNLVVQPKFLGGEGDKAAAENARVNTLPPIFDYIERELPESGWLVEDRITLADLAVAAPLTNLFHVGVHPDANTHPKLAAYRDKMFAHGNMPDLLALDEKVFERVGGKG